MDLNLYKRVLRRFWWLIVPGVLIAFALAFLSLVRVSPDGIAYRKPALWESQTLLLLTQHGFPWGRTVLPSSDAGSESPYADPSRLSGLTDLYSQFANSDEVRQIMRREGAPKTWKILATPITPTVQGATLPVIALAGRAQSPREAVSAAASGRRAFIEFVARQQQAAEIPRTQRIDIQVLKSPTRPLVVQPRKKTLPIMVFLAVVTAAVGLAFVLDNLRPPVRAVASTADPDEAPATIAKTRRTA
jgi:hypothetical protein